jgi:hypothetical protein
MVVIAGAARGESPATGAERFRKVKSFRLTVDYQGSGDYRAAIGDEARMEYVGKVTVSAHAVYRLVKSEFEWTWSTRQGDRPAVSVTYEGHKTVKGKGTTLTWIHKQKHTTGGSAAFSINPKNLTYTVGGAIDFTRTVKRRAQMALQLVPRDETEESEDSISLSARDEQDRKVQHLPGSGLSISGAATFPAALAPMDERPPTAKSGGNFAILAPWARASVRWTITPWEKEDKEELVIEPTKQEDYDQWLPLPRPEDSQGVSFGLPLPLFVTARILPKKPGESARAAVIDFFLEDVSRHPGLCNNFPRGMSVKDDLRFRKDQPKGIEFLAEDHVRTKDKVTAAFVLVESRDAGAYGKVRASAGELALESEHRASGKKHLAVPRDDDGNHVADAWEKQMGLTENHPADWDEDEKPAQKAAPKGDGVGLYREYRGFVVLAGGARSFVRTDPRQKELFVIDDGNVFDPDLWYGASQIKAYRLDSSLTKGGTSRNWSRNVDFNAGSTGLGNKYAVRLEVIHGLGKDKDCADEVPACTRIPDCGTPRGAEWCKIFPDRILRSAQNARKFLRLALTPGTNESQWLSHFRVPPHLAQKALDFLNGPGGPAILARQMQTLIVTHEVGHACSLSGHTGMVLTDAGWASGESAVGNPQCPMRYPDRPDDLAKLVLQIVFQAAAKQSLAAGGFCRSAQFDCFDKLNVKD